MTDIYLLRHSESFKPENVINNDSLQVQNEKWILSLTGEEIAQKKSLMPQLQNFDVVISSNYVRALGTAKYFASDNIKIMETFGERKYGANSFSELPKDFSEKQFLDFDYKFKNGESLNDVLKREYNSLMGILETFKNQKILIVGHSTSFAALLTKWCEIDQNVGYKFKNKIFFDGQWKACQCFKLEFDDNHNLIEIENI